MILMAFSSVGSFTYHTCCDSVPRFIRSHPKDGHPRIPKNRINVPKQCWNNYSSISLKGISFWSGRHTLWKVYTLTKYHWSLKNLSLKFSNPHCFLCRYKKMYHWLQSTNPKVCTGYSGRRMIYFINADKVIWIIGIILEYLSGYTVELL
jgi:hypothetical protein